MGKPSAQIDVQRAKGAGGGSSPFAFRGGCIRLPAGRRAARVASSLSCIRSAAGSRERRSSIRGCSG